MDVEVRKRVPGWVWIVIVGITIIAAVGVWAAWFLRESVPRLMSDERLVAAYHEAESGLRPSGLRLRVRQWLGERDEQDEIVKRIGAGRGPRLVDAALDAGLERVAFFVAAYAVTDGGEDAGLIGRVMERSSSGGRAEVARWIDQVAINERVGLLTVLLDNVGDENPFVARQVCRSIVGRMDGRARRSGDDALIGEVESLKREWLGLFPDRWVTLTVPERAALAERVGEMWARVSERADHGG